MQISKDTMRRNFERNMNLLKREFPHVHQLMENYKPIRFRFIYRDGRIDIFEPMTLNILYDFHLEEFIDYQLDNFLEYSTLLIRKPPPTPEVYTDDLLHTQILRDVLTPFTKYESYSPDFFRVPKGFAPFTVVIGIGGGVLIKKLLERFNVKKLYVAEPNVDFFYLSLFLVDWEKDIFSKINKDNVSFQIGVPPQEQENVIYETQLRAFFEENPFTSAYAFIFRHYRTELTAKILKQAVSAFDLSKKGWGFIDDEMEAFEHFVENLNPDSLILHTKKKLKAPERVFVVGSGPSLDETIEVIKKNQDKALIFACGTALNPLLKEGITPDFLVEFERTYHINEVLNTVDQDTLKSLNLLAPDIIHPEVPPRFKETFYYNRTSSVAMHLLKPKTIPVAAYPTVTNAAVSVSLEMGVKEIYLFGVDFGFKEGKEPHASGTVYEDKFKNVEEKLKRTARFILEGNFGGIVFTDSVFNWARRSMEECIFYYRATGKSFKIYNCSDGAKIAGTESLRPENLHLRTLNKSTQMKRFRHHFSKAKIATSPLSFEKIIEGVEFAERTFPKAFKREVKTHEDLYVLMEDLNGVIQILTHSYPAISTFIRGTLKHAFHLLYVGSLCLKDFDEIEPAFKDASNVFLDRFYDMMDRLKEFLYKREDKYRKLSSRKS
ncbi:motility associated factor glycosyltransferase family protein [Desulfurobacterium crinifex]